MIIAPQYRMPSPPRMAADKPAPCPPEIKARLAELRAQLVAKYAAMRKAAPHVWL